MTESVGDTTAHYWERNGEAATSQLLEGLKYLVIRQIIV